LAQVDVIQDAEPSGVGPRGIVAGVVLVLWINFWITYAEYVVHASRMNLSHFPVALFASFVVLIASLGVLQKFSTRFQLSKSDLSVDHIGGAGDPWSSADAASSWQSFGAMLVMVFWGLWVARYHIADVIRHAWRPTGKLDDRSEMMSYRSAVLGILVYMVGSQSLSNSSMTVSGFTYALL
jgi:hypothetical protein